MSDITVTTTAGGVTVVTDTLGAAAAAAAAAASASAASSSASAASVSAANALTSENNAETAETNAEAALADALAIYGSIAAVQAAEASAVAAAAAAAASELAAQTAETNAETAETNAESAQTAAAASATSASASATTATNQAAAAAASALSAGSVVSQDLSAIDRTVFSATIVDTFLYDTSKDSDGGAWRKRCAHTSWENETLSGNWLGSAANETAARAISGATTGSYYYDTTAAAFYTLNAGSGKTLTYRGNVRQFPAQVLITVEANRVVIWDITQAGCPMWMVFGVLGGSSYLYGGTMVCVAMLNGVFSVGFSLGIRTVTFPADIGELRDGNNYYTNVGSIASRNSTGLGYSRITTTGKLVNTAVNDVAMTVLPNAPVDVATGLPIPVIDVFTDAGTSRINSDGTVADLVDTAGDDHKTGCILASGDSVALNSTNGNVDIYKLSNTLADTTTPDRTYDQATVPALLEAVDAGDKIVAMKHRFAVGQDNGVNVLIENPASVAAGMIAYITKDYNSGWMPGDIRGAWLADTVAETKTGGTDTDRSVKANDLTVSGSLTKAAVASGAQLVGYSGFSAANYLEQPYSSDLDFGTGDFCVMGWLKYTTVAANMRIFDRAAAAYANGYLVAEVNGNNGTLTAYTRDSGGGATISKAATIALTPGAFGMFVILRRSGVLEWYVNGSPAGTIADTHNITNTAAVLRCGLKVAGDEQLSTGTLSLLRAGATAPTAEQIKHIYETEKALFEANANCCLAGTSNAVTALAYDEETDLLHVGTSYGRSAFKGLVRVSSEATPVGAITALAAGAGVIVQGGATAVDVYVPAYTLREELLRDAEQMAKFGQNLVAHDFTATASQEVFTLPVGWEIVAVYQQGTLKRETTAWVRTFDGFKWSVDLVTGATVSDWISILAKRV